jgi:hypothetical protein
MTNARLIRVVQALQRVAEAPLFAYVSIAAIQVRVMWGIWEHRDLTPGDGLGYWELASQWADDFRLNVLWTPLYQALYGSMQWFSDDTYGIVIAHRVLIAVAASLLVLMVLRCLLSPGIAWALALWWTLLPVYYDTIYEVHLFMLLPALAAVVLAVKARGPWMRAGVLAIFLAGSVLIRQEWPLAALAWGVVWLGYELWRARGGAPVEVRRLAVAAAAAVAAGILAAGLVLAADPERADIRERAEYKHGLNICQVYAYGVAQREEDFDPPPLTQCQPLMEREFGTGLPSMREAVFENPGAMAEHFAWNLRLTPYGLQMLLFDATSGPERMSPDYIELETGSSLALAGSLLVLAFAAFGLTLLWRDRRRWWEEWIRDRAWGWAVLLVLALLALFVLLTTRPRPSYLFAVGVLILAVIGMSAMAIGRRWPALNRLSALVPLAAVGVLIAAPSHYQEGYENPQTGRGQPIKQAVDRLEPFADRLRGEDVTLVAGYPQEAVCPYLGGSDPCTPITLQDFDYRPQGQSAEQWLAENEVDYLYLDGLVLNYPDRAPFVRQLRRDGWSPLAGDEVEDWVLLESPGA